jgi:hypothetical protein
VTVRTWWSWAGLLLAVVLLSVGATRWSEPVRVGTPPLASELTTLLHRVRSAWEPAERARVLAELAAPLRACERELLVLLADRGHAYLAEAIQVAGALRLAASRGRLTALAAAGPVPQRLPALLAAETIAPCSAGELADLLSRPDAATRSAAFRLLAGRQRHEHLGALLDGLRDADAGVRASALAALPATLADDELARVMALAMQGDPAAREAAFRALGRLALTARTEAFLAGALEQADDASRHAILDALARKTAPLEQPEAIVALLAAGATSPGLRARALWTLERTGTFRSEHVPAALAHVDRFSSYFAARCLAQLGHPEAVPLLVELAVARPEEFAGVDRDHAQAVSVLARRHLAEITGLGPTAPPAAFEEWARQAGTPTALRLAPVRLLDGGTLAPAGPPSR